MFGLPVFKYGGQTLGRFVCCCLSLKETLSNIELKAQSSENVESTPTELTAKSLESVLSGDLAV